MKTRQDGPVEGHAEGAEVAFQAFAEAVCRPVRWMMRVVLPWPPQKLSPNVHVRNLAAKWGAARRYRDACSLAVAEQVQAGGRIGMPPPGAPVLAHLMACPPDRRERDLDNILAACKHGLDGVAIALLRDDTDFRPWVVDWGAVTPGGAVVVTLRALGCPRIDELVGGALD